MMSFIGEIINGVLEAILYIAGEISSLFIDKVHDKIKKKTRKK